MILNYTGNPIEVYSKSDFVGYIGGGIILTLKPGASPIYTFPAIGKAIAEEKEICLDDDAPLQDRTWEIKGLPNEFDCHNLLIVTDIFKRVAVATWHPWCHRMISPVYVVNEDDNTVGVIGLVFN